MDDLLGKVVVINLDRDTDKWAAVKRELRKTGTERFERLPATDGNALSEEAKTDLTTPTCAAHCTSAMIGCAESHRRAWRMCVDEALPSILVLEDDVVFDPAVVDDLRMAFRELPDDWSLLLLGCFTCDEGLLVRSTPFSEHLARPAMIAGTHAYAVSRKGARELLRLIPRVNTHIDWTMSTHLGQLRAFSLRANRAHQADMDQSNIAGKAPAAANLLLSNVRIGSHPLDGRTVSWLLSENFARIGHGRWGVNVNAWVTGVFTLGMVASLAPGARGLGLLLLALAADAACAAALEPSARTRRVAEGYGALAGAAAAGWGAGRAISTALRTGRAAGAPGTRPSGAAA